MESFLNDISPGVFESRWSSDSTPLRYPQLHHRHPLENHRVAFALTGCAQNGFRNQVGVKGVDRLRQCCDRGAEGRALLVITSGKKEALKRSFMISGRTAHVSERNPDGTNCAKKPPFQPCKIGSLQPIGRDPGGSVARNIRRVHGGRRAGSGCRSERSFGSGRAMPNGSAKAEALKKAALLRKAADARGITFAQRGRPRK